MKMNATAKDLDITAMTTLCVQTMKVVLRVNARMDGPVMVSFAQVGRVIANNITESMIVFESSKNVHLNLILKQPSNTMFKYYTIIMFRSLTQMKMNASLKDLDITVTPTLCVQTLKVVSRVNAGKDGLVMVSFAQVGRAI